MSLRHTRLLRIVNITHGGCLYHQRAFRWRGEVYLASDLEAEGVSVDPWGDAQFSTEYPGWDRRWKPCRGWRKTHIRDRTYRGALVRRAFRRETT